MTPMCKVLCPTHHSASRVRTATALCSCQQRLTIQLPVLRQVLRMLAQFDMLEEADGRVFAPSTATRLLVRGKEATLGHFVVRHQSICISC